MISPNPERIGQLDLLLSADHDDLRLATAFLGAGAALHRDPATARRLGRVADALALALEREEFLRSVTA
jgi:hypothetical protein